jgi:hypothetical protein
MSWLIFAFLTVGCWGVYGVFLKEGAEGMGGPGVAPDVGRYKAFLFVGIAYFLVAIIGPAVMLMMKSAAWTFPTKGLWMSLVAGIVGAVGAFGVLLAYGAGGKPGVVMSIIFAGAPVVNSVVIVAMEATWSKITWPFVLGIVLAAAGGSLVTLYRPQAPKHAKTPAPQAAPVATEQPKQG